MYEYVFWYGSRCVLYVSIHEHRTVSRLFHNVCYIYVLCDAVILVRLYVI